MESNREYDREVFFPRPPIHVTGRQLLHDPELLIDVPHIETGATAYRKLLFAVASRAEPPYCFPIPLPS